MSEDQQAEASLQGGNLEGGGGDLGVMEGNTEPSMLLQKLKSNISKSVQTKVDQILLDVQRFSDNDKLYLYLQLPSGPSSGDKSGSDSASFNTADQLHTCNWIRSHLEEHCDTCLPKQDVYETYRRHCENLQHRPLSAANFGKIIRDIFPNIKARRLGGRGQSKYCYSGIRRRTVLNMPLLPPLDLKSDPAELTELVQTYKQEVTEAACELICDWAQKILKRSFDTVVEIARYLIQEHLVNPRCSRAELVTSAALAGAPAKPHKVIKKTPLPSRADGEGAADHKKELGDSLSKSGDRSASAAKPSSLEAPPPSSCPSSSSLRPAVEAFMKQLPRILPRSSVPDKTQLSVRSSPPSLVPRDSSGVNAAGVKVIAMATLPQQPGGPVPVVILPQGCLSYEREKVGPPPLPLAPPPQQHASAAPTSVLQKPRGNGNKRLLDAVPSGSGAVGASTASPVKRKRGRPRKPRPEEALPPPPPPPPAALSPKPPLHPPIITSVGGVIQKASSSQPVLELLIQEQPGLVLGQLPAVSEHRGVVVQCKAEPDRRDRPLLFLQSPAGNPGWELSGRLPPMVEVIQKAPRPGNNSSTPPPATHHHPLPPPRLHQERGEVEITLTPVELHVNPPSASSSCAATSSFSSITVVKSEEDGEPENSTSSKTESH